MVRRLKIGVLAAALLTSAGASVWATQPDKICDLAAQWLLDNKSDIPTTLAGLNEIPLAYRRAAFATFTPEQRARVFGEHLSTFLGPRSSLNSNQQQAIRELLPQLPQIYDAQTGKAYAQSLEPWLKQNFDKASSAIFSRIGNPSMPGDIDFAGCNCHIDSFCSCDEITNPETECKNNGCANNTSLPEAIAEVVTMTRGPAEGAKAKTNYSETAGCGCFWLWSCNGYCVSVRPPTTTD